MQHAAEHRFAAFEAARHALADGVGRVLERGYLHAAMAVCALAASADGEVSLEERYAIDAAIAHDPLLERFSQRQAVTVLDDQLHRLRHDPVGTREALLHVVERAGRRPERAIALMRLALDVIKADDVVRPAELHEFEMLCDLLGLEPADMRARVLGV